MLICKQNYYDLYAAMKGFEGYDDIQVLMEKTHETLAAAE